MSLRQSIAEIAEKLDQLHYGRFNIQDAGMGLPIKWGLWECIKIRECRESELIPTFPIWAHTTINACSSDGPVTTAHFHFIEDPMKGLKLDSMIIRYRDFYEGTARLSIDKKIPTLDHIPSRRDIEGIVKMELSRQEQKNIDKKDLYPPKSKSTRPRL